MILVAAAAFLALGMATLSTESALPAGEGGNQRGSPMAGRKVFVEKGCQNCHAIWGSGGELGPDLATISRGRTFPQIAGLLWSHTPRMLEMMEERKVSAPSMSAREMSDLVSYLYYLSYFDDPGDANRGGKIFRDKGCADCHHIGPSANAELSSLNGFASCFSPSIFAQAMWNAARPMSEAMEGRKISQPLLEGRDLADILAWINKEGVPASNQVRTLANPGDPTSGALIFKERQCIKCHKVGDQGADAGRDLTFSASKFTVAQVAGSMWNHAFKMLGAMEDAKVPQRMLAGNDMADMIAYLFFAPYEDFPGNADAGRKLFTSKGCGHCHDDQGVKWDEDLLAKLEAASEGRHVEILAAFWNHAPQMERTMRSQEMTWPRFKNDEMRDLLTYLSSTLPSEKKVRKDERK